MRGGRRGEGGAARRRGVVGVAHRARIDVRGRRRTEVRARRFGVAGAGVDAVFILLASGGSHTTTAGPTRFGAGAAAASVVLLVRTVRVQSTGHNAFVTVHVFIKLHRSRKCRTSCVSRHHAICHIETPCPPRGAVTLTTTAMIARCDTDLQAKAMQPLWLLQLLHHPAMPRRVAPHHHNPPLPKPRKQKQPPRTLLVMMDTRKKKVWTRQKARVAIGLV